tara:strand:+ start:1443 stop:4424 length:2982 start_codon:yes stop_codon:yes gene_type:complete
MTDPFEQAFQSVRKRQSTLHDWDDDAIEDIGLPPKPHPQHGGYSALDHSLQNIILQARPEAEKLVEQWGEKVPSWMGLNADDFHVVTLPGHLAHEDYGGGERYTGLDRTALQSKRRKKLEEGADRPAPQPFKTRSEMADYHNMHESSPSETYSQSWMMAPIPHALATLMHRGMPFDEAANRIKNGLHDTHKYKETYKDSEDIHNFVDAIGNTHVPIGHLTMRGPRVSEMYMTKLGGEDDKYGLQHRIMPNKRMPVMAGLGLGRLLQGTMLHRLGSDAMGSDNRTIFSEGQTQATKTQAKGIQQRLREKLEGAVSSSPAARGFRSRALNLRDKISGTSRFDDPKKKFEETMFAGLVPGSVDEQDATKNRLISTHAAQLDLRPGPQYGVDRKTWEDLGWGDLRPTYGAQHHLPKINRPASSPVNPNPSFSQKPWSREHLRRQHRNLLENKYGEGDWLDDAARNYRQHEMTPLPHEVAEVLGLDTMNPTLSTTIDGQNVPLARLHGDPYVWDIPEALTERMNRPQVVRQIRDRLRDFDEGDNELPEDYLYQTQLSQWQPGGRLREKEPFFDDLPDDIETGEPMEIAYRLLKSIMDLGADDVSTQPEQPLQAPANVMEEPPRKALGIMGHHDWHDLERFDDKIGEWIDIHGMPTHIVSDGSSGTGAMASQWALDNDIPIITHKPNFRGGNRFTAPAQSRQRIVNSSDHILAFPSINGSGTMEGITMARQAGKPVHLHYIEHPHDTPISEVGTAEERERQSPWLLEPTPERTSPEPEVPQRTRRQVGAARGHRGRRDDNVETGEPMDIWSRMLKEEQGEWVPEEQRMSDDELTHLLTFPDLPEEVREDVLREIQRRQNINTGEPMDLSYRLLKESMMGTKGWPEEEDEDVCCKNAKAHYREVANNSPAKTFLGGWNSPNDQYMECAEFEMYLRDEIEGLRDMASIPMVADAITELESVLDNWEHCDEYDFNEYEELRPEGSEIFTAGEPMDLAWRMFK